MGERLKYLVGFDADGERVVYVGGGTPDMENGTEGEAWALGGTLDPESEDYGVYAFYPGGRTIVSYYIDGNDLRLEV